MTTVLQLISKTLFANYSDAERARLEAATQEFANRMTEVAITVGQYVHTIATRIENGARQAEIDFQRAQLRDIYRRRVSWKKGDLHKLRTYPLNRFAQKRLAALEHGRSVGRPTIASRRTLARQLVAIGRHLQTMVDPQTLPTQRLRLLKCTPWWALLVEATYRGEYERLNSLHDKGLRGQSVSNRAEHAVADAFLISVAELKRLRYRARKDPRFAIDAETPLTVADLEVWKKTGSFTSQSD